MMKKTGFIFALVLLMGFSANAQISDPSYKKKILKVVRIQGAQDFAINQAIEQMGKMVPDEKKDEFEKEMNSYFDKLIDQTADVYMQNYTEKEVDALYDFYNSPIGKKIQRKMPKILEESNQISQEFAQEIMPLVQKYIKY